MEKFLEVKMSDTLNKRNYNAVDLMKFIMAIVVVAIHTHPFEAINNAAFNEFLNSVTDMAVPFFFLASGYMLALKLTNPFSSEKDLSVIKKYTIRMAKLYLLWTAVYFPLMVYEYIKDGLPVVKAVLQYLQYFVFVGDKHLWYLLSAVYALLLIMFLLKCKLSPEKIAVIAIVISLVSWAVSYLPYLQVSNSGIVGFTQNLISHTVINGRILRGAIYIPIGMLLTYRKLPKLANILLFIVSFAGNCLVSNSLISQFLLILSVVSLFGIAECICLNDSVCYKILRKMSTVVYFIHIYVLLIWSLICDYIGAEEYGVECFLAVTAVSVLIAFLYVYIKHKKNLHS